MSEYMRKCSVCEEEVFFDEEGNPMEGQSCPSLGCPFFSLTDKVDEDGELSPLDFNDQGC